VPEDHTKFSSDKWIPDIRTLCLNFLTKMQQFPGGHSLCFKDGLGTIETPGEIVREYHATAIKFKAEMYGDNADYSLINYHKIAALYIRAFLKCRPFYFDNPDETKNFRPCIYTKLANEFFSIPFLEAIFKGWNDDFDGLLSLDPMYKFNFIKQLYRYKNNIDLLDPVALSEIIHFIEQQYFYPSILA